MRATRGGISIWIVCVVVGVVVLGVVILWSLPGLRPLGLTGGLVLQSPPIVDLLDQTLARSSPDATNCGRVKVRGNPTEATDCAMGAFKQHKPFKVRYDQQGIDSSVAVGFAGRNDGTFKAWTFDGDFMGGGGTSATRQRVDEIPCPMPLILRRTKNGKLTCFPAVSKTNSEQNNLLPEDY